MTERRLAMERHLNLAEELLLLALNDEKGTVLMAASMGLPYGLAGGLVIELIERGLLRIEGKMLVAGTAGSARDEVLDGILGEVRAAKRARNLKSWVGRLGRSGGKIKPRLLERLVGKGILRREEHRLLLVFPAARYPQIDPMPEFGIRERVRSGLRGLTEPDDRTAALISLVHACDLTGMLFEKGERREAKKRAKEISAGQPVGSAVAQTVEAVRAAVIVAAATS
jgi:Golgi phosphoprotein 3